MQLNSRSRSVSNRGLLALASVIIALLAMVPFEPTASAQDSAGQLDQLKAVRVFRTDDYAIGLLGHQRIVGGKPGDIEFRSELFTAFGFGV